MIAIVGIGVAGSLAGCSGSSPKKPDDAPLRSVAERLATSLAAGSLDGVPLTGTDPVAATAERRTVFADVPVRPSITVQSVARVSGHDDRATATLAWSWPILADHPWTYTTTVRLEQGAAGATATTTASPTAGATPAATAQGTSAGTSDGTDGWSVAWDPTLLLPGLTADERVDVTTSTPQRGQILDRDGKAIVKDRAVRVIGIDKTLVAGDAAESAARKLAKKLGLDADAYTKQVSAAGAKAFVEAITLRTTDPTDVDALLAIHGVRAVDDSIPLAPTRDWARPILGTVGAATAEIVAGSGGRVQAGDSTGLSGIEKQYDPQLAGTRGVEVRLVPAKGSSGTTQAAEATAEPTAEPTADGQGTGPATDGVLFQVAAVDGTPVRLTLDSALQTDAEQILAGQTVPAAIVAIDTKGEVLAVASATAGNGLSTATTGQFAPGSTMKLASSLALLRHGAKATTKVPCTTSITVDGRTFSNDADYPSAHLGKIPLATAFANSCNTAFISQATKVSQQDLHDAAADLGIGVPSALGVPAFFGSVPTTGGGATDHAASMIGQGRVEASPLTMATVAATVAAGHRVSPVLVEPSKAAASAGTGTGTSTASPAATAAATATAAPSALTKDEVTTLRTFMRGVVTSGTGTILSSLPGDIGAKTGTAQFGDGSKAHAWMIATDGDVGVAVFVDEGQYGATTAGPLLKQFLQDLAKDRSSR